jgi:molybdate transport system substrate-binding protein
VGLALLGVACGGGGDDDEADAAPERGDPNSFTIWALDEFQKPLDTVVAKFKEHQPDIDVTVVYGGEQDLNDRLLVGERPDLFLNTDLELDQLADDGTLKGERSPFGQNELMLTVQPGNPKNIQDVSVFGFDAGSVALLCTREFACGRAATSLLNDALVTPAPDDLVPPKELLGRLTGGTADAGLLFRTQTVRARQQGLVEYVPIPETMRVEVPYSIAIVLPGDAADLFIEYTQTSNRMQRILGQSGYAPLEGEPQ